MYIIPKKTTVFSIYIYLKRNTFKIGLKIEALNKGPLRTELLHAVSLSTVLQSGVQTGKNRFFST
jgi:hypothetical protein